MIYLTSTYLFFFFYDTATTEIYTLSLHDALPISLVVVPGHELRQEHIRRDERDQRDRKSTRLNSSHVEISYDGFCLKKKKKTRFFEQADDESQSFNNSSTDIKKQ